MSPVSTDLEYPLKLCYSGVYTYYLSQTKEYYHVQLICLLLFFFCSYRRVHHKVAFHYILPDLRNRIRD